MNKESKSLSAITSSSPGDFHPTQSCETCFYPEFVNPPPTPVPPPNVTPIPAPNASCRDEELDQKGLAPVDIIINDFDADGINDLLSVNLLGTSFTICKGFFDNNVVSALNYRLGDNETFPTRFRGRPVAIESKDFNSDAAQDIMVLNSSVKSLSFFPRTAGANPYPTRSEITLPTYGKDMESADLDNDGDQDVLVLLRNQSFMAYLNNGLGSFTQGTAFTGPSKSPLFILTDLDNDGDQDILTVSSEKNTLDSARGIGGANFSGFQSLKLNCKPVHLAAGRIDSDPFVDAAVICENDSRVYIYRNNGGGLFTKYDELAFDNYVVSATISDYNGDGIGDIIVSRKGQTELHFALSSVPEGYSGTGYTQAGDGARKMESFDFNLDGFTDVLTVNRDEGSIGVFLGNNNGTFGAMTIYPTSADPGYVVRLDYNGDGFTDLAVSNENVGFDLFQGSMTGIFTPQALVNYPAGFGTNFGGFFAEDFTNDGNTDLLVVDNAGANQRLTVYIHDGVTPYLNPPSPNVITTTLSALCAFARATILDYDADGNLDAAVSCRTGNRVMIYQGDGAGNFVLAQDITTFASDTSSLLSTDFDGDGDDDLIVNLLGGGVQLARNTAGVFTPLPSAQFQNSAFYGINPWGDIRETDFDGDAFPDFLIVDRVGSQLIQLSNDGSGNFTKTQIPAGGIPFSALHVDLNSDGKKDLLNTVTRNLGGEFLTRISGGLPGIKAVYDRSRTISFENP